MKKIKLLTFLLLVSISVNNANALISKKSAENIRFWTMVLTALDIALKDYKKAILPEKITLKPFDDFKVKIFDTSLLEIEIPKKLDLLQFDKPNDSHISINPIALTSNIFAASQEKTIIDENILIPFLDLFLRIENLNQNKNIRKDLLPIEPGVFLAEKLLELLFIKTLDATIKDQKLLKRLSRVIILTAISSGGTWLRSFLAKNFVSEKLEKELPKVPTVVVNKLVENLITEFFAELLQRYIIEDPEKQKLEEKKKKFQQKLEEIIAATNSKNNSDKKTDKEKKSFVIAPAS